MIKKIFLTTLFFCILVGYRVEAHTPIEDSSPKDGEIITEELHEVSLKFGTTIEETSKFDVLNTDGEKIEQANFTIQNNVMTASFYEPLENGSYEVNWSIIGEDGHPIEGIIKFAVNQVLTDQSIEEVNEAKQPEEKNLVTPTNEKEEDKQINAPNYLLPSIIGLLAVIAIVSIFVLMRRKK